MSEAGGKTIRLMEVCGTHTMAIARSGLKQLLPPDVKLLSGPGCPVCVTPAEMIDLAVSLCERPDVTVCSYGDMLRVPGTSPAVSLLRAKAAGARVEMVYSPMNALALAKKEPAHEVVFLGVGFETTLPGTLAAVRAAAQENIRNFSILPLFRRIAPAIRALLADGSSRIDGFLCPGHVAVILGAEAFRFLPEEYGLPAVVGGFEPEEIWPALKELIRQAREGDPRLVNLYERSVSAAGNPLAQALIEEMAEPCGALWRGLGHIADSAYTLRPAWEAWNAATKFGLSEPARCRETACRCGDVIRGRIEPAGCPFFGTACTPESPLGPCMVSGEGSCAAAYLYR